MVRPIVPAIVSSIRWIADNMKAIGTMMTTGIIYIGLRSVNALLRGMIASTSSIFANARATAAAYTQQKSASAANLIFKTREKLIN